jgi:ABC-2 type transport system ATP-binding protein
MSSPRPAGISVRELSKRYGSIEAARGVSFDVAPGEIFGLLGLNGAGKTTTLECILGLREADAGTVEIAGRDARARPEAARRQTGAVLQVAALQDKITPRQALGLFASFYQAPARPEALLEQFDLADKADATFDSLSGGQKQRLFLALALVNQPQVLVLDEPTAGLDPQARRGLHRHLLAQKAAGRAVLLSTHYLEEAQQLCDRVGILHEGRLVATAAPADLITRAKALPSISFRSARPIDPVALKALPGVAGCQQHGDGWGLSTREVNRTLSSLVQALDTAGNEMLDVQIHRPSLEEVFLELTGRAWHPSETETTP